LREQKHHHGHQFFLVLAAWPLGSAKFVRLQRQKPAMFAQMPLFVYRHFTGAACATSSDGRFALFGVPSTPAFLLPSRLSDSSDIVRSPTSRSRPVPIGRLFSAPNSKLFAGNYGCNRRSHLAHGTPQGGAWNRMRGLCVAVAQVAKVKAGCVAHRSEETEDFNFKRFSPCKERGSPLTVNMGVEE